MMFRRTMKLVLNSVAGGWRAAALAAAVWCGSGPTAHAGEPDWQTQAEQAAPRIEREISARRELVLQRLPALRSNLAQAEADHRDGWTQFLRLDELERELRSPDILLDRLAELVHPWRTMHVRLDDARFLAVQYPLRDLLLAVDAREYVARFRSADAAAQSAWLADRYDREALEMQLRVGEPVPPGASGPSPSANIQASASSRLLLALLDDGKLTTRAAASDKVADGRTFRGAATVSLQQRFALAPSVDGVGGRIQVRMPFDLSMPAWSSASARNTVYGRTNGRGAVTAILRMDHTGLRLENSSIDFDADTAVARVRTQRAVGQRIVEGWVRRNTDEIDRQIEDNVSAELLRETRREIKTLADRFNRDALPLARGFLDLQRLPWDSLRIATTGELLVVRGAIADAAQPLPTRPSPAPRPEMDIVFDFHETAVNNFFENFMGGRREQDVHFLRFIQQITTEEPRSLRVFAGAPRWSLDMEVRRPMTMDFRDDRLTIGVRARSFVATIPGRESPLRLTHVRARVDYLPRIRDDFPLLVRSGELYLAADASGLADDDRRLALDLLREKLSGLLGPEISTIGLSIPRGARADAVREYPLVEFRAADGWLQLAFARSRQPSETVAKPVDAAR